MHSPVYFDYLSHARGAGLDDKQIEALVARWREDYGDDWNLLELRLLRICKALEEGEITYEEALAPEPASPPNFGFLVAEDGQDYGRE